MLVNLYPVWTVLKLTSSVSPVLFSSSYCNSSFRTALLSVLVTRHSNNRPTPATLPTYPFFSSLSISTLNFLDRSTFASKTREEKVSFMKGLTGVLDKFSDGLKTRKILPSLVEEVRSLRQSFSHVVWRPLVDERYPSLTLHPSQRFCDITIVIPNSIRNFSSTKSQTVVCYQRTTAKYVDTTR